MCTYEVPGQSTAVVEICCSAKVRADPSCQHDSSNANIYTAGRDPGGVAADLRLIAWPCHFPLTQEINVHASLASTSPPGNNPPAAAKEDFVDITVNFVELTPESSKVAQTLYRADESAYRAACGQTHALLSKKRRRLPRAPMKPDYLAMVHFGKGMKLQVGGERWGLGQVLMMYMYHVV